MIRGLTALENVDTKYICDLDASRGAGAMREVEKAQGHAPQRVADMREVLDDKDVDAVVISMPEHSHAVQTVHACESGKYVYVEKPASCTVREGKSGRIFDDQQASRMPGRPQRHPYHL